MVVVFSDSVYSSTERALNVRVTKLEIERLELRHIASYSRVVNQEVQLDRDQTR